MSSLIGVKDQFLNFGKFKLNSGSQITFWEDKWLGTQALKFQYPNLFNIVRKKHGTLQIHSKSPLGEHLVGSKLIYWHSFVSNLAHINLNEGMNLFVWNLHNNGLFTVKSMYNHLVNNNTLLTKRLIIIYK